MPRHRRAWALAIALLLVLSSEASEQESPDDTDDDSEALDDLESNPAPDEASPPSLPSQETLGSAGSGTEGDGASRPPTAQFSQPPTAPPGSMNIYSIVFEVTLAETISYNVQTLTTLLYGFMDADSASLELVRRNTSRRLDTAVVFQVVLIFHAAASANEAQQA